MKGDLRGQREANVKKPVAFSSGIGMIQPEGHGTLAKLSSINVARLCVLALTLVGCIYFYHTFGVVDATELREMIANSPHGGAAFVGLHMIATLVFVPRFVLVVAATLVFGPISGFIYATGGAMAAAALCFLIVRIFRPNVDRIAIPARLKPLFDRVEQGGWQVPTLALLVPGIPFTTKNFLLALLPVSFRNFSIATLLAHAPSTLILVYFAHIGMDMSEGANIAIASISVLALLAGGLAYGVRKIN